MLPKEEQERLNDAIAVLSEHFPNYAVAVLSTENELLAIDYSRWRIGRMLFRDALEDMEHEKEMIQDMDDWSECIEGWDDDDDDDDERYDKEYV